MCATSGGSIEGWWTGNRTHRRYFDLVLEDGRNVVVFWDHRGRQWFGQRRVNHWCLAPIIQRGTPPEPPRTSLSVAGASETPATGRADEDDRGYHSCWGGVIVIARQGEYYGLIAKISWVEVLQISHKTLPSPIANA